ncbi:3-isopropylmalate dehydrogenase [Natronincola ferrireducens]|uniref:3-isopropylmalate dehydrogenase n=1 Tax=Natronincola ferrireducens TaxID=393762 RepID=A0A1G9EET8_9FIRM|nr:3-isopropylmalate dehydrogenase [Natronincola ferrireducens]SDK74593.1 3-isopropylmalate dehydrogenase [Natronincola ferrireducens]
MKFNIATIPGDGIGPEVIEESMKILKRIGEVFGHEFSFQEVLAGGVAIDKTGEPLPLETIEICKKSDAVLLGAVGGPKWDSLTGDKRPEKALLGLRGALGLYANIRPAVLHDALKNASPLRSDILGDGIDICVVRELTGGIYFGDRGRRENGKLGVEAYDTEAYSVGEVERIARTAFEIAKQRNNKVTNVDKANVLESSRLWRSVVEEVAKEYPEVTLEHMYVDNAAMQLIRRPQQFDVLVTTNMFGDILSDEASMITGSIGMLPSASLGEGTLGMYEPIHGSAPDIAGENKANPIATILSTAMMLRFSFGLEQEAKAIEDAVTKVLGKDYRTADIMSDGMKLIGTKEMGELVLEELV